ncbi:MAG: hypothetical protein JNK82_20440 [Myxococcaceae bacterium]|nr:hypothetical protein [Myxococcaceae bacterium]
MTHDDARAQIADLFEGNQGAVHRDALRAHLKACDACRASYDQTALAMRRMLGAPDEMTPEELYLFEPPLPAAKVVPLFKPAPSALVALAAGLIGIVLYWGATRPSNDDFGVRGGAAGGPALLEPTPSVRAVCVRGDQVMKTCAEGDQVLFAATPLGNTHVKVYLGAQLVGEGEVSDGPETPLPWAVPWKPGLELKAVFSKCATCQAAATVGFKP